MYDENIGCKNCGIIEPFYGEFCSEECEKEYRYKESMKKIQPC